MRLKRYNSFVNENKKKSIDFYKVEEFEKDLEYLFLSFDDLDIFYSFYYLFYYNSINNVTNVRSTRLASRKVIGQEHLYDDVYGFKIQIEPYSTKERKQRKLNESELSLLKETLNSIVDYIKIEGYNVEIDNIEYDMKLPIKIIVR